MRTSTLPDQNREVVVISAHFKCCGFAGGKEDDLRVQQSQQIVEAVKRMRQGEYGEKERRADLKERKLDIPKKSEVGAKAVNLGLLLERLAPTFDGFTFNKNDCRSLFDPIDYVIFEGLSTKQAVTKILFVDIKSGGARLSPKQKKIKSAIEENKVEFERYKT